MGDRSAKVGRSGLSYNANNVAQVILDAVSMKQFSHYLLIVAIGSLAACADADPPQEPVQQLQAVTVNDASIRTGQTVYIPIYSHIYSPNRTQKMDLAATLSIRNTDMTNLIIITSANYYNTAGEQVHQYLEQPVELNPLASTNFVVDQDDTSGGSGASFVVEWVAETQVSDPVIEAVMINTAGNQGLSLISNGRVIKERAINP